MRLLKLAAACGFALICAASGAWAQAAAPSLTPSIANPAELVFTPIPPCRAFLTSTALAASEARSFVVVGTSAEFAAQGGPSTGCGIPPSAAAVALSLTSFASTGTGHLRSAAFGDAITGTQVLSFRANATETAGVTAAVKSRKLTIKAYTAGTKIAADITGYYAPQIRARIDADGMIVSRTNRILSAFAEQNTVRYVITIDRDPSECSIDAATNFAYITPGYIVDDGKIYIEFFDNLNRFYTRASFRVSITC